MASRGRRTPEPETSADDAALWRRVATQVTPLKRPPGAPSPGLNSAPPVPGPPDAGRPAATPRSRAGSSPPEPPRPPALAPGIAPGLDQRTLNRLKRGLIPPESRIDLHNMTQDEAHRALVRFLAAAQAAGRRSVLVITGKGYGTAGAVGILKTNVPRWINEPPMRDRVLAFSHASQTYGGEGALFVLLRRPRPR